MMPLPDKAQLGKYMNAQRRPPLSPNLKTSRWNIYANNSGGFLGGIAWQPGWRQYVFFPAQGTIFSVRCMTDIQNYIALINKAEGRSK